MILSEFRQKYPEYSDLNDQQLAEGLYKKNYSDIPFDEFSKTIGLGQQAPQEPSWGEAISGHAKAGALRIPAQVGGLMKAGGDMEAITANELARSSKDGNFIDKLGGAIHLAPRLMALASRAVAPELRQFDKGMAEKGQAINNDYSQQADDARPQNIDPDSTKRYVGEATEALIGSVLPAVGVGLATRSANAGLALMGGQVYGEKYAEAIKDGRAPDQAQMDAVFYAVSEAVPERLPLGIALKQGGNVIGKILKTAGAEGLQEMFTEVLQMGYEKGVLDDNIDLKTAVRRVVDSGIVGGMVGGGMATAAAPFTRAPKQQDAAPDTATIDPDLIQEGNEQLNRAQPDIQPPPDGFEVDAQPEVNPVNQFDQAETVPPLPNGFELDQPAQAMPEQSPFTPEELAESQSVKEQQSAPPVTAPQEPAQMEGPLSETVPSDRVGADWVPDPETGEMVPPSTLVRDPVTNQMVEPDQAHKLSVKPEYQNSLFESPPKQPKPAQPAPADAGVSVSGDVKQQAALPETFSVGPATAKTSPLSGPVYRETNTEGLFDLLLDDKNGGSRNTFVSDDASLAIGQGNNKGVKVEMRGDLVSGVENKKPGTGIVGGKEYQTNFIGVDAVQRVTVDAGVKLERGLVRQLLKQRFDKQVRDDGSTVYTKKGVVAPVKNEAAPVQEKPQEVKTDLPRVETVTELPEQTAPVKQQSNEQLTDPQEKSAQATPEANEPVKENIKDVGEKIGGARKDVWSGFRDSIDGNLSEDEILKLPLSKTFPEPDYVALADGGVDAVALAAIKVMRDEIPAKGRTSYKKNRYLDGVKTFRDTAAKFLEDSSYAETFVSKMRQSKTGANKLADRIELMVELGFPKSGVDLNGITLEKHKFSVYNGEKDVNKWIVDNTSRSRKSFGGMGGQIAATDTREEAVEALKNYLAKQDEATPKTKGGTKFEVYKYRKSDRGWVIGKKVGRNYIDLAEGFESSAKAREHATENHDALEAKLKKAKEIPAHRRPTNELRVGDDYRDGKDVGADEFRNTFGFRGVEFGNWVEQGKRQADINDAYDGLMDLAKILDIPPKAISLNGELGMAFGARGRGGKIPAKAHYEPGKVVINLTKKNGAGSLAHEWFHGLDNYFSRLRGEPQSFVTDRPYELTNKSVRKEMLDKFKGVMSAIKDSGLPSRSRMLDSRRSKPYWATDLEMAARSFESYLIGRLKENDMSNDYLANIVSPEYWDAAEALGLESENSYPYPLVDEHEAITKAYDELFEKIEHKQTDKGVALFGRKEKNVGKSSTVAQVRKHIADTRLTFGKNAPKVEVVQSVSELPDHIQKQIGEGGDVAGVHDLNNVYLVADNLSGGREALTFLAHEAVGHFAVENMMTEAEFSEVLDKVQWLKDSGNKKVMKLAQEVESRYGKLDEITEAKEIIAVMAEKRQFGSVLGDFAKKVYAAIRRFLKKLGFPSFGFSNTELEAMLVDAGRFLRKDNGKRKVTPDVLFHDQLGDIDLELGKNGRYGASQIMQKYPELGPEIEDLVAGAELTEESAGRATLKNGDTTFKLIKRDGRWSLAGVERKGRLSKVLSFGKKPQTEKDAKQILEELDAGIPSSDSYLQQAKDWASGKVTDSNRGGAALAMLTRQHIADIGSTTLPQLRVFEKKARQMDASRNKRIVDAAKVVEEIAEWGRKNKPAAIAMYNLMHDTTVASVDPSKAFKRIIEVDVAREKRKMNDLQALDRPGEAYKFVNANNEIKTKLNADIKRKQEYPALKARYDALPAQAKEYFQTIRDMYAKRLEETEQAMSGIIDRAQVNENVKRRHKTEIRQKFESMRVEGPYFPLARFGDYWMVAEKGDVESDDHERLVVMRDKAEDLKKAVKEFEANGYTVRSGEKIENIRALNGASEQFVDDVLSTLDGKVSEIVKDDIYQMWLATMPDMSMRKHFIHRKKTAGYSEDGLRALADNMFHGAYQLAKMEYADQMQDLLTSMEEQAKESKESIKAARYVSEMQKRYEWMMNPQAAAWTSHANSLGFLWFLGVSPAAALVNVTQTPLVAFPVLGSKFGFAKAGAELTKASKDFFKGFNGKDGQWKNAKEGFFSLEHSLKGEELTAFQALVDAGVIDKTLAHDLIGQAENTSAIYRGNVAKAQAVVGYGFHHAERMNREVTALAAFRLARKSGMNYDQALELAADRTFWSHFDYSNANKARFMQGNIARVALMFRQFSLNMTYLLVRNSYQSVKGESAAVKSEARKQLAAILGMHALAAGAMGMPWIWDIAEVVFELGWGDEDEPKELKNEFLNFLGEHMEPEAVQALAFGVPYAAGGDLHSRVGLDSLWIREGGGESLEGSQWAMFKFAQLVGGPIVSAGANMFEGVRLMGEGQTMRGIEKMVPKFARDGIKAYRYAEEGVQTRQGASVVDELSAGELALQSIGLTPSEVSWEYEQGRAIRKIKSKVDDRRQLLMNRYNLFQRVGDYDAMEEVRQDIQKFNQVNYSKAITIKSLRQSAKGRARAKMETTHGVRLNKRDRQFADEAAFGE